VLDRAVAALFALLTVGFAIITIAVTAGWLDPLSFINTSRLSLEQRLGIGLIAVILFLLAVRFLLTILRAAQGGEHQALISSADLGTVSITIPALESLVTRAARQVKGVREVKPRLKVIPGGLVIRLNITVNPDRNLPELTATLQEKVHEYIVATAGLDVPEVQVRVNSIYRESLRRVE